MSPIFFWSSAFAPKPLKKLCLGISLALGLTAFTPAAQALPNGKWGIEVGGGANVFVLPYGSARISWRPEASPWAPHLTYTQGADLNNQWRLITVSLGGRYYFQKQGPFEHYFKGELGWGDGAGMLLVGLGTEMGFSDHLALTLGIDTGYGGGVSGLGIANMGFALRPELHFKFMF